MSLTAPYKKWHLIVLLLYLYPVLFVPFPPGGRVIDVVAPSGR